MTRMKQQGPQSVYLHVPFCLHHCGYCDFTLVAGSDRLVPDYLTALENELISRPGPGAGHVKTIFVGGGTPTYLQPSDLSSLLNRFLMDWAPANDSEFSIEANPDGLCDERLNLLRNYGVNRLSLGVQSFDDDCLRTLERRHSATQAVEMVQHCQKWFDNISVDLIFGVPGQTIESWKHTLQTVTSLPVTHVSTYGLTYEQGTPFFRREKDGLLRRAPDDLERDQYLLAMDHLCDHGFEHYEVSNFAKPGFQCRHNQTYWNANEYEAFGPGAARYLHGVRTTNCRSVTRWIRSWLENEPCVHETETLNDEDRAREAIMLALRMTAGLHVESFEKRFQVSLSELASDAVERHQRDGLLEHRSGTLRLTRAGLLLGDTVVTDFL
ncbi:MAG: radical SAM family heme chaperone HemW [Planctomyces sp.]